MRTIWLIIMKKAAAGSNVRVVCRVRPMNAKEQALLENARVDSKGNKIRETCTDFNGADPTAITVFTPADKIDKGGDKSSEKDAGFEKHNFNFDYVFECKTEQAKVYEVAAKPIIESD